MQSVARFVNQRRRIDVFFAFQVMLAKLRGRA
jgi:hypothetical protein